MTNVMLRFRGHGGGRAKCCAVRGGVQQKQIGGCYSTTFHFPLFLFGFFVLSRPTRTAPAERGKTGATSLFHRWRGSASGVVQHLVQHQVQHHPSPSGGRSRPKSSLQEGSDARPRARADAPTGGAMTRRVGGFLLTAGGMSWYCVAPGAGVSITGQVVIAASCIWFARKGGRLPLPAPAAFASRRRARTRGIGKMKSDHLPARAGDVGCPAVHQPTPTLEQVERAYAASTLFWTACASAASMTSRGWSVSSAAQSRNEDRKPCATAAIRRY